MPDWLWVVIVIAAIVLVLAALAYWVSKRRRSGRLRSRFGDEYERELRTTGSRRRAESHLTNISDERDRLEIRPLNTTSRERYLARWQEVQARFVDQPGHALDAADTLVTEVMRERGYPVDDFEVQAGIVALDHPDVVRHYRAAHEVHDRTRTAVAGTEEVRVAMIQYRSLFESLLSDAAAGPNGGNGRAESAQAPDQPRHA